MESHRIFAFLLLVFAASCQEYAEIADVRTKQEVILGITDENSHRGTCRLNPFKSAMALTSESHNEHDEKKSQIEKDKGFLSYLAPLNQHSEILLAAKPFYADSEVSIFNFKLKDKASQNPYCLLGGRVSWRGPNDIQLNPNFGEGDVGHLSEALQGDWQNYSATALKRAPQILKNDIGVAKDLKKLHLYYKKACVYYDREQKRKLAAWELKFFAGKTPVTFFVHQGELLKKMIHRFHGTAQIQAFDRRKKDGVSLDRIKVTKMQSSGYLCNDVFSTTVPLSRNLAFSKKLSFLYPPSDVRFQEASLFANANEMWSFFRSIGFSNWGEAQIELFIQEELDGGPSYINPDIASSVLRPRIYVAQESIRLENLATDFDVVGHELSHHAVAQFVGAASEDENRAMHEALSDIFVMLKTGDPCLGETICRLKPSVCSSKQCLRNADNSLNFTEDSYKNLSWHQQAQLITGLIWDLHKKHRMSIKEVSILIAGTLKRLSRTTNFAEFTNALLSAQKSLSRNNPDEVCLVFRAIFNRGMVELVSSPPKCTA